MDDAAAHSGLAEVLDLIDRWGLLYEMRWGYVAPHDDRPDLAPQVDQGIDKVRARTRFARELVKAMGEVQLAEAIVEHEEGAYGGHPFSKARVAIVEAMAVLEQREELASIVGPVGPRLSASELHPTIWGAAAKLWDDGHLRAAVQTASTAFEGMLQAVAGPSVAGESLAALFSLADPTTDSPRLRLRGLDPASKTWKSAHEGAAALVRGAFMAVRNLVSHPGWNEPTAGEAIEMLTVLSYVANLVERSETVRL